jgi:hypothetical protein
MITKSMSSSVDMLNSNLSTRSSKTFTCYNAFSSHLGSQCSVRAYCYMFEESGELKAGYISHSNTVKILYTKRVIVIITLIIHSPASTQAPS